MKTCIKARRAHTKLHKLAAKLKAAAIDLRMIALFDAAGKDGQRLGLELKSASDAITSAVEHTQLLIINAAREVHDLKKLP